MGLTPYIWLSSPVRRVVCRFGCPYKVCDLGYYNSLNIAIKYSNFSDAKALPICLEAHQAHF